MSEEHYPARSTGNNDIDAFDFIKYADMFMQPYVLRSEIKKKLYNGQTFKDVIEEKYDSLATTLHPNGRTARTLCKGCNTFLGKYDEAYLKFFNADGNPKTVNGFQKHTKYQAIKAIYAKFLSVPETKHEEFDFIDFIKDEEATVYNGTWNLYFVKRNRSTDFLGLKTIETGKITYDEGVVYEMSDEKFIFNLMDFPKHSSFEMTPLFDILNKNYELVEGVGDDGAYHAQILMSNMLSRANRGSSFFKN